MPVILEHVMHVNVNCTDLVRSLRFYQEDLGLGLHSVFHTRPETQDLAGFGLGAGAWDAHLLSDARGFPAPCLDLLEWKEPGPVGRPYAEPSHLGYARIGFSVRDLDGLHRRLADRGVERLSAPGSIGPGADLATGRRSFCGLDPDGTTLEFVEGDLDRLRRVTLNCSSLERSSRFYREVLGLSPVAAARPVAREGREPRPSPACRREGELLGLAADPEGLALELVEWKQPPPVGRPYAEANHLGIYRLAFLVEDVPAAHAALRDAGAACPLPPGTMDMGEGLPRSVGVLLCFDPDGAAVELIENPA